MMTVVLVTYHSSNFPGKVSNYNNTNNTTNTMNVLFYYCYCYLILDSITLCVAKKILNFYSLVQTSV